MSEIPRISSQEAIAAFEKAGWLVCGVSGSHHVMKKDGHRFRLSIPVHGQKTLGVGLLASQIKASGLSVEEFRALLRD